MNQNKFSVKCEKYGKEIDRLIIQKDYNGLLAYLKIVETFSDSHNTPEYAPIFYYLGTANSTLASHFRTAGAERDVTKHQKQSLYYQRKALSMLEQFDGDKTLLLCVYTNYANDLSACGRVIEALKFYRKAISLNPRFGMAVGNYGRVLSFYANLVNDPGHYRELHCYAYQAIRYALDISDPNMHDQAIQSFQKMINQYETSPEKYLLSAPIRFGKNDLGEVAEEKYRKWCLENHLFLNPLNDTIALESAFAHDPLTITQYTENINRDGTSNKNSAEPPKWFSMLNQLKEEYIYSRFLCYEGSEKIRELHYADKNVKLSLSSYDYVNYSIRLEQLKSAFKNLYSIFDQIAFLINCFWKLGLLERHANAHNVFNHKKYPKNNIALMSIYWSYYEHIGKFRDTNIASEEYLKTLRNAFEHKFVKVHEYQSTDNLQKEEDDFYHISESELIKNTLRLLELAREWIMELVYAIGIEESTNSSGDAVIHLNILDFDDEWKV